MSLDLTWWTAVARDAIALAITASAGILLWLRKRSSRHWPIAFGKVESASTYQDNFKWLTDVSYSYSVEKDFYSGQFQLPLAANGRQTIRNFVGTDERSQFAIPLVNLTSRSSERKTKMVYAGKRYQSVAVRTEHESPTLDRPAPFGICCDLRNLLSLFVVSGRFGR